MESIGARMPSDAVEQYRARLDSKGDADVAQWAALLLRESAARHGPRHAIDAFAGAAGLAQAELPAIFAAGGGSAALIAADDAGRFLVPATTLRALVAGTRLTRADARERFLAFLVAGFHDFVYA